MSATRSGRRSWRRCPARARASEDIELLDAYAGRDHRERMVIAMAAAYANLGVAREGLMTVLTRAAEYERRLTVGASR